jgi:hypothetical protein
VDNRSTHSRAVIAAVNFAPDVFADALVFFLPARRLGATLELASSPDSRHCMKNLLARRWATAICWGWRSSGGSTGGGTGKADV